MKAYKYGSDLIPITKEEEQEFYTFPAGEAGLQIRGFVKASDVRSQPWRSACRNLAELCLQFRPEWALNDPQWLFQGQMNEDQLQLSALLWAMKASNVHALVRILKPKEVQPRLCLLIPLVGDAAVMDGFEVGLLVTVRLTR